MAVLALYWTII